MPPTWQEIRCACIPLEALSLLADLRREARVRVTIDRGRAWVWWDDDPEATTTRLILVERLLPLAGVEIFAKRAGRWYRPGERLPAFDVPMEDIHQAHLLDRVILPEPLEIGPPASEPLRAVPLRLVRDDRGIARPATALRCHLSRLAGWIETAPSVWIESLIGTWYGPEVLLLGPTSRLPWADGGTRFWGEEVLIPMGSRAEPELSGPSLSEAVGAGGADVVLMDEEGAELIPRSAFRPLSRASLRLAMGARPTSSTIGGPPS